MTKITRDEWIAELERLTRQRGADPEGLTIEEIALATDRSTRWVGEKMKLLKDRLVAGRKRSTRIDGIPCYIPCYSLRPLTKAAKKR